MILVGVIYQQFLFPHNLLRHLFEHEVLHRRIFSLIKILGNGNITDGCPWKFSDFNKPCA